MDSLQVIPVIDLRGGTAVHARGGARERYRPVRSPLGSGEDPVALARALVARADGPALYVADLDALAGAGDNVPTLAAIGAALPPATELWVDAGADGARPPGATPVLGTETLTDPAELAVAGPDALLSLDLRHGRLLGPPGLLETPDGWPRRLIVMALARVGTRAGPDLTLLARVIERAGPGRRVYAAGGVRHHADLHRLAALGAAGALVATALHEGRLGPGTPKGP